MGGNGALSICNILIDKCSAKYNFKKYMLCQVLYSIQLALKIILITQDKNDFDENDSDNYLDKK